MNPSELLCRVVITISEKTGDWEGREGGKENETLSSSNENVNKVFFSNVILSSRDDVLLCFLYIKKSRL